MINNERQVGIESIHAYMGPTFIDVKTIFEKRGLNIERFDNLMMEQKAVALPCEDPVTNAVNAAKPLIDQLSEEEKNRIEWVITGTESGLDFGKSLATYVHAMLGLSKSCRLFETKNACYAGTAALQMALGSIASGMSPGAKALVIATDVAQTGDFLKTGTDDNYAEPALGTGAVAILISDNPKILAFDLGANGLHGYEVMDTCRPTVGGETGDVDLSLMSYMDCAQGAVQDYLAKVDGADFQKTFDYLAFHTPFAGMVKGCHRTLMRKFVGCPPDEIEEDFVKRLTPSFKYTVRVGNVYSATTYLALCGLIDGAEAGKIHRVGLFSYGSGCSSEFFSGLLAPDAGDRLRYLKMDAAIERRHGLSFKEYEQLCSLNSQASFGVKDAEISLEGFGRVYDRFYQGKGLLALEKINGFHREYRWS